MVNVRNNCDDCYDSDSFCLGIGCPDKAVVENTCDECGSESDDLFEYYGEILCEDCLRKNALIKEFYDD